MNYLPLASLLAISAALALNACSGGASSSVPTSMNVSAATNSSAAAPQRATGTLTIGAPQSHTAANVRKVAFVSPSTRYATLWIDGTLSTRQVCSSVAPCSLNWVSTSGPHTFATEVDDSLSVGGSGNVLADASAVENLTAGQNTFSIQLAGVPAQVAFVMETALTPEFCAPIIDNQDCFVADINVTDADSNVIPGGSYDNLGVCILVPSPGFTGCFGPESPWFDVQSTTYTVECADLSAGSFSVTAAESYQAYLNGPSATEGEVTTAELANFNLTYPNQNNYAMIGWPTYSCNNTQVSVSGPAQGSVTVQSHATPR
jgi:hypothetical protein